jgi:hypothetical protein
LPGASGTLAGWHVFVISDFMAFFQTAAGLSRG